MTAPVSNYKPEPGHLGNLNPAQQHALDTLKKQLTAEGHFVPKRMDDSMLLRFLRECKFDVGKANTMVLSAEQWRKEFGVDDIVKNFHLTEKKEVNQYYPQYYHKTDKDGRPVYIERLGKIDVDALEKITNQAYLLRRFILGYEKFFSDRLPACTKAVGHNVETSCTILDIGGVRIGSLLDVKKFVSQTAKISRERYPETMGKFYIVNAPRGFSVTWKMIEMLLDEETVQSIHIVDAEHVKETLLAQIAAENLPAEFGGTCKCPGGCASSDAGPWQVKK